MESTTSSLYSSATSIAAAQRGDVAIFKAPILQRALRAVAAERATQPRARARRSTHDGREMMVIFFLVGTWKWKLNWWITEWQLTNGRSTKW